MIFLIFISLLILIISSCKDKEADSSHESDFLNLLINDPIDDIEAKQRAQLALSKLEDDVIDPEPLLIAAVIHMSAIENGERMFLTLILYDEDEDYIGFVIEEESVDSNNTVTKKLVEKYPAYTYTSYTNNLDFIDIPVLVRDANQRKSEEQWLKYLNTSLQKQEEEYMKHSKKNWTWKDSIPPVWLSKPDPGKLNVYVRVYDRAGHLSERIPLLDKRSKWPSENQYQN